MMSLQTPSDIHVVVQFHPWFKFYFPLCLGMVMNDNEFETKENKIQTRDKTEPQHRHRNIYGPPEYAVHDKCCPCGASLISQGIIIIIIIIIISIVTIIFLLLLS